MCSILYDIAKRSFQVPIPFCIVPVVKEVLIVSHTSPAFGLISSLTLDTQYSKVVICFPCDILSFLYGGFPEWLLNLNLFPKPIPPPVQCWMLNRGSGDKECLFLS